MPSRLRTTGVEFQVQVQRVPRFCMLSDGGSLLLTLIQGLESLRFVRNFHPCFSHLLYFSCSVGASANLRSMFGLPPTERGVHGEKLRVRSLEGTSNNVAEELNLTDTDRAAVIVEYSGKPDALNGHSPPNGAQEGVQALCGC